MSIRITAIGAICAVFLNIGAAAMQVDMTVERLRKICEAPNVEEAATKGDELGWQRLTSAETQEWRAHFVRYNGGSVRIVGWRHVDGDASESLSFWVAAGPNGHRACAYSTNKPAGFLTALSKRLGSPDTLDNDEAAAAISASWKRGAAEYSFAQVGSSAIINIVTAQ